MFEFACRDSLVDVDTRTDIARNATSNHHHPEESPTCRPHERQKHKDRKSKTDRQSRTRNKEESNAAWVVNTRLHKPPAQHLHVLVVRRPVMLCRVFDQPGYCFLAGILQRASMIGFALFVSQDARRAT